MGALFDLRRARQLRLRTGPGGGSFFCRPPSPLRRRRSSTQARWMEPDPQASQSADPESGSPSLFSRRKTPLLLSQFHGREEVKEGGEEGGGRGRKRKKTAEEKEEEEEEEKELPIMHWEDLSQRIAELEQQERSERSKRPEEGEWRDVWEEDEEDLRKCRVAVVSSRFQHHKNLQLCFVNNSDSEEDEEKEVSKGAGQNGCRGAGLKQEVCVSSNCVSERKHGATGAAAALCDAAEERERQTTAGSPRSELSAGFSAAGSRPAEDEAGRHAAGRPGPHLTQNHLTQNQLTQRSPDPEPGPHLTQNQVQFYEDSRPITDL
ncbi:hypothetical protein F7725_006397 [Dissostichus mawsoni]|uniref:Uncharacterized protein n=1 Tax=Dissostichus mawsoni TaxID=36200 RepID=A0A7J5XTT7_DISMA|nr:hypothetical protein F7725_006397 [Dissostichus mawsoni]